MKYLIAVLLSLCSILPSSYAEDESPTEGLQAIINLYKSKDFDTLLRERYAEIHKAKTDDEIEKLVKMFSAKFSNEKRLNKTISIYEKILLITPIIATNENPQITESDKIAQFPMEDSSYKLYLLKTGKWGFHL